MDINSILETMLSSDTVSSISESTGASKTEVKNVLKSALPSMLQGASNEANDKNLAGSFLKAVTSHANDDTSDLSSFLSKVDTKDGSKALGYLLSAAGKGSDVTSLSKAAKTDEDKTSSILSMAAPLLLSLLGQSSSTDEKEDSSSNLASSLMSSLLGNTDTSSLISGLLGSISTSSSSSSSSSSNKKKKKADSSSSGLADILTGLLK